ncbi:hypothetical protein [Roseibium sp. Sym1]|uniref:hypothetical protein n=1 Tax=Roseibium sp. Sym1 TaxID=3016006 RepID=UPI0022B5C3D3|nr:hypothetical protein [Roseibium sp. Sym1]
MFKSKISAGLLAACMAGQLVAASASPANAMVLPAGPSPLPFEDGKALPNDLLLVQYNSSESMSSSSSSSPSYAGERDPRLSASDGLSDRVTRGVVWLIESGGRECQANFRPEYRVDCFRNVLARAASTIENRPGYQPAARELRSLSRKLDRIVTRYQDPTAPRVSQGRRSYRAVAKASLEQANREASAAIDETVTKLLRSAGNSEKRKTHYSQIATAVGSSKRLLRS